MTKIELITKAVAAIRVAYQEFKATKALTDQIVPMRWKKTKYAVAGFALLLGSSALSFWAELQKYEAVEQGVQIYAMVTPAGAAGIGAFNTVPQFSGDSYDNCYAPIARVITPDFTHREIETMDRVLYTSSMLLCPVLGLTSDEKFDAKYNFLDRAGAIE